jgi:hypothetical protein
VRCGSVVEHRGSGLIHRLGTLGHPHCISLTPESFPIQEAAAIIEARNYRIV